MSRVTAIIPDKMSVWVASSRRHCWPAGRCQIILIVLHTDTHSSPDVEMDSADFQTRRFSLAASCRHPAGSILQAVGEQRSPTDLHASGLILAKVTHEQLHADSPRGSAGCLCTIFTASWRKETLDCLRPLGQTCRGRSIQSRSRHPRTAPSSYTKLSVTQGTSKRIILLLYPWDFHVRRSDGENLLLVSGFLSLKCAFDCAQVRLFPWLNRF